MENTLSKIHLKILKDEIIKRIFESESGRSDIQVNKEQYEKQRLQDTSKALDTVRGVLAPSYALQTFFRAKQSMEGLGVELNLSLAKHSYLQNLENSAIIENEIIDKGIDVNLHDVLHLFRNGTYEIYNYQDSVENYLNKIREKISKNEKVWGHYYIKKLRQVWKGNYALIFGSLGDPSTKSGVSYWIFGANFCLVLIPHNNESHCLLLVELRAGRAIYKIIAQKNIKNKIKRYMTEFS